MISMVPAAPSPIADDFGGDLSGWTEPDICIVGSGPAGLSLAYGLRGRGMRILLLAGGGRRATPRSQSGYRGRQSGTPNESLTHARFKVLGGTGTRWAGLCRRHEPEDFAPKPGLPWTGWPIDRGDLDPYYDAAERLLQTDGPSEAARDWEHRLGRMDGLENEGLRLEVLRFARRHDLSADAGDLTENGDVRILVDACAAELAPRSHDGARRGLIARLVSGRRVEITPRALVLACGAVETARLLLVSRGAEGGVRDDHDQVGRCFMDHIYTFAEHIETDAPERLAPLTVSRFGGDADDRGCFALWRAPADPLARPCGAAAFLIPRRASQRHPDYDAAGGQAVRHVFEILKGDRILGRDAMGALGALARPSAARTALRHLVTDRWRTAAPTLRMQVEALPDPDSRISLGSGRCELGLPRAKVHWITGDMELQAARDLRARIGEHVGRAGLGRLAGPDWGSGWPPSQSGGKHHMGGARMSDRPERGVVDQDLKVHGEQSLYVAGAATFPTGGWTNPTLTIVALSLRLADRLRVVLSDQGRALAS